MKEPVPFIKTRYRVQPSQRPDADHWSGGKTTHKGATCPTCKVPLLLLWDLNCHDPRFAGKLDALERLPLFFCWRCVNDISYQVAKINRVRIHRTPRPHKTFSLYPRYPKRFERRPLSLHEGVPDNIRRLVKAIYDDIERGNLELTPQDRRTLRNFFGHPVISSFCTVHHQLGGKPISIHWAQEVFKCPNPKCDRSDSTKKPAMRFLAGVLNDPWGGLPMIESASAKTKKDWNFLVGVQFHICDHCLTITAANRCD